MHCVNCGAAKRFQSLQDVRLEEHDVKQWSVVLEFKCSTCLTEYEIRVIRPKLRCEKCGKVLEALYHYEKPDTVFLNLELSLIHI